MSLDKDNVYDFYEYKKKFEQEKLQKTFDKWKEIIEAFEKLKEQETDNEQY